MSKEKSQAVKFIINLGGTLMHNVRNIVGVIITNGIIMQFRRINLHVFQRNRATEDEILGVICMSYIQLFVYLFLSILSASYDQEC